MSGLVKVSVGNILSNISNGRLRKCTANFKKRGAVKQLSRDNPGLDDEEDSAELESGTFKKADEVLASRRIVKVRRKEPSAVPAAAPNPFAGIQLVPASAPPATAVGTNPPLAESKLAPAEAVVEGKPKGIGRWKI